MGLVCLNGNPLADHSSDYHAYGHSALVPKCAGNADESGRGTSWRDSGSRLGLGAGADREAFNEGRSQAPPAAHRERSSFTDRSNSRG